jgi:hypothetical protein
MNEKDVSNLDWLQVELRIIGDPEGDHVIVGITRQGFVRVVAVNVKGVAWE